MTWSWMLVFRRWMNVVLIRRLPPERPCSDPVTCSKRQAIDPTFGQLCSEPAVIESIRCAQTLLLLTKELCQVGCRRAADWGELVRICVGTQKVSDDLDGLILKQGGFRTSVNNGPRKPCACGQAHMPLRPHRLHRFGWDLSCSPQSQFALLRCTT